ncbi:hypothetical protein [Brevundimonas sp.]|jgi:hypothetical protein|uniref:hypothetical protein n=1 Tax=Brevundimonas sp. TaxID=1871086 RepID=UPI003D1399A4
MQAQLKTDQALLDRLKVAASHKMTREEVSRQRLSFVYGNMPIDSVMTRQQVSDALERLEGEPA